MAISLHTFARRCFWALPASLRNQLHDVRHTLARWFRSRPSKAARRTGDLDWPGFRDGILNSVTYRAVIIFEPNIDWGVFLFQRPHHMALAFGRHGCLVIYETTGDEVAGFRQVDANVWIASDPAVKSIPDSIRIFYSTSQLADAKDIFAAKKKGRVIYEYIDHIDASISGGRGSLRRLNRLKRVAFDGNANIIVSSATALHREAVAVCGEERCVLVPNGVDVRHYRDIQHLNAVLPDRFAVFRKKYSRIVGYFGAIAPWLWYDVIAQISALMPDVGFVFIGPDYSGCVSKLSRSVNVLYLGAVDYSILPAYARLFDVCFIPFRPSDVARSTSPLKLFEYFALEKPVVVTADMSECVVFSDVFAGGNVNELIVAIQCAFAVCDDKTYRARLRALAEENDWNVRALAYLSMLDKQNIN